MNKICTSLEQSQKLIELRIDRNTADMYYTSEHSTPSIMTGAKSDYSSYVPAWSLAALLDILPNNEVTTTTVTRGGWNSETAKYLDIWFADYETEKHDNDFTLSADTPLDAAFELVCLLKEKGKI